MTSLKTSIKTITYLSDIGCLEIHGASLPFFLTGAFYVRAECSNAAWNVGPYTIALISAKITSSFRTFSARHMSM